MKWIDFQNKLPNDKQRIDVCIRISKILTRCTFHRNIQGDYIINDKNEIVDDVDFKRDYWFPSHEMSSLSEPRIHAIGAAVFSVECNNCLAVFTIEKGMINVVEAYEPIKREEMDLTEHDKVTLALECQEAYQLFQKDLGAIGITLISNRKGEQSEV